jgi:hypothetical protein
MVNMDKHTENVIIFENLRATAVLVGILNHFGKINLPRNMFLELLNKQEWPNDFITNHGSMMCVTYDEEKDTFGFEIRYKSDGKYPENAIGFQCTRGNLEVGHIDYNSPHYRN